MWVRILGRKGDSDHVVLPRQALRSLGWERGDFLRLEMKSTNELLITRFNPATVPDRATTALESLPQIQYA